jgi:hypothetical protein
MPNHRKCTICGKPIVLRPSANERARKYGQSSKYYLDIFTEHSECTVAKRERDTLDLIKRHYSSTPV